MKKNNINKHLLVALITLVAFKSQAQNVYLKVNGGYNFGTTSISESAANQQQVSTVTTYEKSNIKFGKGFQFAASVGLMFNKYIGTELQIGYLLGTNSKIKQTNANAGSINETNLSYSSNMLSFTPSLVLTPGFDKLNPYARFGMCLGLTKVSVESESKSTNLSGNVNSNEAGWQLSGGLGLGFTSSLGVAFKLNDKFTLFAELSNSTIMYKPKKGEIVLSKTNGVDDLATYTVSEKETEFVDEYTYDSSATQDKTKPTKEIRPNLSLGGMGFQIGTAFHF
jgi:opacity protein-like surface antigen